jgi:acyl carrier protein
MITSENKLKQVLADVFGIETNAVDENTSVDTVEEWDSLKHLNLVLALESEYDISLTEEQTVEILSYPLIKAVLEEHGIQFN